MKIDSKASSKVLKEIMAKMDEMGDDKLKSLSPKFAKVQIDSNDPKIANEIKGKVMEGASELGSDSMDKKMLAMSGKSEMPMESTEGESQADDIFQKLPEEQKMKMLKQAGLC